MEGRGSAAGHLAVVAMVLVLVMAPGALAANHVVGGTQEWTFPPTNDAAYYTTWAANQTFAVGDTLLFEYTSSQHDVVQLSNVTDYNACSGTPVKQYSSGNDSIPLSTVGTFYFICSIPGHCTEGMKVSVTVGGAVSPATPPPTTPSPPSTNPSPPTVTSPPPPPGSGASSGPALSMAGLLIAALVASLAFLV